MGPILSIAGFVIFAIAVLIIVIFAAGIIFLVPQQLFIAILAAVAGLVLMVAGFWVGDS